MDKRSLVVGLIAGLVVGALAVSGMTRRQGPLSPSDSSSGDAPSQGKETAFYGFDDVPKAVADIKETIRKDNETEQRIGPDTYINEVRLISSEKIVWPTTCLTFWLDTLPPDCEQGTYPGYDVFLSVDGDLQHWKVTEQGELGSIGAGMGHYTPWPVQLQESSYDSTGN
jgi:hypothetical protein